MLNQEPRGDAIIDLREVTVSNLFGMRKENGLTVTSHAVLKDPLSVLAIEPSEWSIHYHRERSASKFCDCREQGNSEDVALTRGSPKIVDWPTSSIGNPDRAIDSYSDLPDQLLVSQLSKRSRQRRREIGRIARGGAVDDLPE